MFIALAIYNGESYQSQRALSIEHTLSQVAGKSAASAQVRSMVNTPSPFERFECYFLRLPITVTNVTRTCPLLS